MKISQDPLKRTIVFQSYVLDYQRGFLKSRNGKEIFIEHRLKDLFLTLLENHDRFVSKNELMENAWKGTIVSDQSVTKAISDLRKLFAANDLNQFKITTIRKVGYKLEVMKSFDNTKHKLMELMPYTILIVALLVFLFFHH